MPLFIYVPGTARSTDATFFSPNVLNSCLLPLGTPHSPTHTTINSAEVFLPPNLPADGRPGTARAVLFPGRGAIAGCSLPPSRLNLWLCPAPRFQKAQSAEPKPPSSGRMKPELSGKSVPDGEESPFSFLRTCRIIKKPAATGGGKTRRTSAPLPTG